MFCSHLISEFDFTDFMWHFELDNERQEQILDLYM
jgi:hypothetical protein